MLLVLGQGRVSRQAGIQTPPLTAELALEHLIRQGWGWEEIGKGVEYELHRLALGLRIFATELQLSDWSGRARSRFKKDVDELAEKLEDDELTRRKDLNLVCDRPVVLHLVLVEAELLEVGVRSIGFLHGIAKISIPGAHGMLVPMVALVCPLPPTGGWSPCSSPHPAPLLQAPRRPLLLPVHRLLEMAVL